MIFAISVNVFAFFCIFGVHFFAFFMCLIMKFFCVHFSLIFLCFFFMFLCTFFEFFASADRRSRYIRYRDNIRDNQCGENYNIGNKQ